jgi:hypothetical protein
VLPASAAAAATLLPLGCPPTVPVLRGGGGGDGEGRGGGGGSGGGRGGAQPPSPGAQSVAGPANHGQRCPEPAGACCCTHTRSAARSHRSVQADQLPAQSLTTHPPSPSTQSHPLWIVRTTAPRMSVRPAAAFSV